MLKIRLIPCLDIQDARVVKGIKFTDLIDAGDPVAAAAKYCAAGADELCFLDISASNQNRTTMVDLVDQVASKCFIPLTVGGGVNGLNVIRDLLNAGADKVSINTAAINNPNLIRQAAEKFGSQCVVVAIDAKRRPLVINQTEGRSPPPAWEIFSHGGRRSTGIDAIEFAKISVKMGAGELLVTSMDRDGTKRGYDTDLIKAINNAVPVPVIASGGVGNLDHLVDGVRHGHGSALLVASIFHFGTYTISDAKQYLTAAGIPMRLDPID